MTLKPIGDKVVVKVKKEEEKTASGIVLQTKDARNSCMATVIAVGAGSDDIKMEVKVGDEVIFEHMAGIEVEIDNEKYTILRQEEILVVLEK